MQSYHIRWVFTLPAFFILLGCSLEKKNNTESTREVIHTNNAPEAVGPYSQAIRTGNLLFLAGQVGIDPETGNLAGPELSTQTHQALANIEAVLTAAGYTFGDVVEAEVFLADMNDYQEFNKIYATRFDQHPPARAVVEAARLPLDAKVEIKVTAAK